MSAVPRVVTEPLGGSRLARLLADGAAPQFAPAPPNTVTLWRQRIEATRGDGAARRALDTLRQAIDAGGPAAARLRRVREGNGVVVTTGQQAGLFGGPIYTFSKAISALTLADELERETGIPVAPIFWAATDDADLAEASVTTVALPGGAERLLMPPPPGAIPGMPMSLTRLGEVTPLLERLAEAAGSAALADPISIAREAYGGTTTVGGAYVALLRALLQPLGIAVLDAGHPDVRAAMGDVTARALRRANAVNEALAARAATLRSDGHEPQVSDMEQLSLVFHWRDGVKSRVPVDRAPDTADVPPTELSPNVLLRPLAERVILPTVAYVAGPGELAYFAQVSAVAGALELTQPVAVPRWSCTIIEPKVQRLLDKYDFTPTALQDPHAAERRHGMRAMPDAARAALEQARSQVASLDATLRALAADDPTLLPPEVAEGFTRRSSWLVGRLERRLRAAVTRRETDAMRAIATARGSLAPFGERQERTLNFLPFLARHGDPLLGAMRSAAAEHARALLGA